MQQPNSAPPQPQAGPVSWLDAPCTRPKPPPAGAAPEAMAAGFTRDPQAPVGVVRGRAGFEAGGPADVLAPCSVLAELTGQTRDRMAELTDDELIGVLRAARRVQSWQAAVELEAVSELTARRLAEPARPGPHPAERAAAETAAALTLTVRAATGLVGLATSVERLDGVADALASGQIDLARARVFADELAAVEWLKACRIAAKIMLDAPGLTTSQLRARLRRAVLAADPDALRRRQKSAEAGARVETWHESSGNVALAGRELPPASALAADRHLTALARSLRAGGAKGSLDRIRAAVYLALLSGRDPSAVLADLSADPTGDAATGGAGSADSADSQASPTATGQTSGTGAGQVSPTGAGQTNPTGADRDGADGQQGSPVAAGSALRWPTGTRGTINLTMPLSAWLGHTDSPGQIAGFGPADAWTCRDLARELADRARCCLTVTTDDGKPLGHACCAGRPPPGTGQLSRWLADLDVHWYSPNAACTHALATARYRPGARLAHLTRILSPTCTAPGCRAPAERCDLDHLVPHDKGGRTCGCNLHPLCRFHHQCKQEPGWRAEMTGPGRLTWRLPHGRSYTTSPEPYPV